MERIPAFCSAATKTHRPRSAGAVRHRDHGWNRPGTRSKTRARSSLRAAGPPARSDRRLATASGIPLLRPSRDSLRVGSAHGTTAVARLIGPQFGADRRFQTSLAGIRERGRALERNPASRSLPYLVTPAMEFSLRSAPPSRPSAFPLARSNQAHRSAASVVAGRAFTGQRAECALITGQGSPDRVRTGAWPHVPIHV